MASGLYDASYEHDACGVGMVADLHGRPDHDIVDKGLTVLERLAHRGASGAEVSTGDGAGILVQVPHRFLIGAAEAAGFSLPEAGSYAVGLAFLPGEADDAAKAKKVVEALAPEEGLAVLGWRPVPVVTEGLGETALSVMPIMEQLFVARTAASGVRMGTRWLSSGRPSSCASGPSTPWKASTSRHCRARTIVYKGMLTSEQLRTFFADLRGPALRVGPGPGALTVLDQHVPELALGPPLPLHGAQRGDQHAGRQPQLDAGP